MWQSALTSCVGTRGRLPFPRSLQLASIFIISGTISRSLQLALKICDSFKKVGQWYCLVFLLYPEHSRCNDSFLLNSHQFLFFCRSASDIFLPSQINFIIFCKGLPCRFFRKGPLTSLNVWKDWFGASLHLPPHSPVQWMRFSIWRWKYQDCCNNDFCFSDHSTFNQTSKDAYNAQNDPFAVKKITLYQKSYGN